MNLLKRFLSFFRPKKPIVHTFESAKVEIVRIKEMMKPSSMTPVNEVLYALYNFQKALPFDFKGDFNSLKGKTITVNSNSSLSLAVFLIEAVNTPHDRSMIMHDVFHNGKHEVSIFDWYSNHESIEIILRQMELWEQMGIRAHYERYEDGPMGDYDQVLKPHQSAFIFNSVFIKVIDDHISLLTLLIHTQLRGEDLENSKNKGTS